MEECKWHWHTCDSTGNPFFEAVFRGDLEEAKQLLRQDSSYSNRYCCEKEKMTPLMIVVSHLGGGKQLSFMELLLQCGADINCSDSIGCTVLHHASDDLEALEFLVQNGADISIKDRYGDTVLDCYHTAPETVEYLIDPLNFGLKEPAGYE